MIRGVIIEWDKMLILDKNYDVKYDYIWYTIPIEFFFFSLTSSRLKDVMNMFKIGIDKVKIILMSMVYQHILYKYFIHGKYTEKLHII